MAQDDGEMITLKDRDALPRHCSQVEWRATCSTWLALDPGQVTKDASPCLCWQCLLSPWLRLLRLCLSLELRVGDNDAGGARQSAFVSQCFVLFTRDAVSLPSVAVSAYCATRPSDGLILFVAN
jgi:hypothetical protein